MLVAFSCDGLSQPNSIAIAAVAAGVLAVAVLKAAFVIPAGLDQQHTML